MSSPMFLFFEQVPFHLIQLLFLSIFFSGSIPFSKICSNVDLHVFRNSPILTFTMTMDMILSDTQILPLSLFYNVASIVLVAQTYCCVILLE